LYLGPLVAAEGVGLVLGGQALTSSAPAGTGWQGRVWLGLGGTGVLFAALSLVPILLVAVILALCIGYVGAVAVSGARRALYMDFDPVEQRAIAAAENCASAVGVVTGVILVGLFLRGTADTAVVPSVPSVLATLPGLPANELLFVLGIALIASAFLLVGLGVLGRNRRRKFRPGAAGGRRTAFGLRVPYADGTGWTDAAHGGWDGPIADDDEY
jgi:hypothetical protein